MRGELQQLNKRQKSFEGRLLKNEKGLHSVRVDVQNSEGMSDRKSMIELKGHLSAAVEIVASEQASMKKFKKENERALAAVGERISANENSITGL